MAISVLEISYYGLMILFLSTSDFWFLIGVIGGKLIVQLSIFLQDQGYICMLI